MLLGNIQLPKEKIDSLIPNTIHHDEDFILNELPESFDLREAHPECKTISHIQDQSACGSCWANASAGVMSDRICIKNKSFNNKNGDYSVSVADLMSCCHTCGLGCNGGNIFMSFFHWNLIGICSGGDYDDKSTCKPYPFAKCEHHSSGKYPDCPSKTYPTPQCKKECQASYTEKEYKEDKTHGSAYKVSSHEDQIKGELFRNGSIAAGFTVYEDFVQYKSGVYQHKTGHALGGHAVRIIGYGEENGTKYWLVANSWNEDWGDKGYFKILRGSNHCGIEGELVAGIPKIKSGNTGKGFSYFE